MRGDLGGVSVNISATISIEIIERLERHDESVKTPLSHRSEDISDYTTYSVRITLYDV